uniref:Uncharacterized protein n=1 Tax=Rhizophora mucronata TaxID=61149 RepID=A0A2P2QZD9_RHIMU
MFFQVVCLFLLHILNFLLAKHVYSVRSLLLSSNQINLLIDSMNMFDMVGS